MKDYLIAAAIFILILLFTPMLMAGTGKNVNNDGYTYAIAEKAANTGAKGTAFKICDAKSGAQSTVPGFDFICGVVAGEMPSRYDEEALKAQAVAAFSYCCCLRDKSGDAYITTGSSVAYLPRNSAERLWGANFETQWGKIENAVREVYGNALFYNGEVIQANFCSMSSGITESSKDVFGDDLPYLVEVASPGDKLEKDYETHVTVTLKQFKAKAADFCGKAEFDGNPGKFLTDIKRSGAGGVVTATLCGKKISGSQIRELFGLRSTNFTLSYSDGKFNFDVKGYGHGVGMSQCGAQYMALHGKSWREILEWYYKGTTVGDYLDANGNGTVITNVKKT